MKFLPRNKIARRVAAVAAAITLTATGVVVGAGAANAWQTVYLAGAPVSTTVVTEPAGFIYNDTGAWKTIATVYVPTNEKYTYVLARWSTSSRCWGTMQGACHARILIDGVEAAPATGTSAVFDQAGSDLTFKYLSFERIAYAPAATKVELQIWPRVTGSGTLNWDLVGWTLTVQALA
jgi:hypothetical protein